MSTTHAALLALFVAGLAPAQGGGAEVPNPFAAQTLRFEPNRGQFDCRARWAARAGGHDLFLTSEALVLSLPNGEGNTRLDIRLAGGTLARTPVPEERMKSVSHWFPTGDESTWLRDVPHYGRLRVPEVYPGIDLVLYGCGRDLEFDFELAAGTDPDRIALRYDGADSLQLEDDGDLIVQTSEGRLVQKLPVVYQTKNGRRVPLQGRYRLTGEDQVAFAVEGHDPSLPLTIDPVLVWSTYLGGSDREEAVDIAIDDAGCAYVTGLTLSLDFPTAGPQVGAGRIFVAKLDPQGQLLWSGTVGSSTTPNNGNRPYAIDVNQLGVFVVGESNGNMPVTASAVQMNNVGYDGFLFMIGQPGHTTPFYCTYVGGSGFDAFYGVHTPAVGQSMHGSAIMCGRTASADFPHTLGASTSSQPGIALARIDVHSPISLGAHIALDAYGLDIQQVYGSPLGDVIITGYTDAPRQSSGFTGPWLGPEMAFACRVLGGGQQVVWAKRFGGTGVDRAEALVIDTFDNAWIAGWTNAPDFPLVNGIQTAFAGAFDAFVVQLDQNGSTVWSTYLGGAAQDKAYAIDRDAQGNLYVGGETGGQGFPLVHPFMATRFGQRDGFFTKLTGDGQQILWSTLFGGSSTDWITGVAVTPDGDAYVTGNAFDDLPLWNAAQPQRNGGQDAFVARFTRETMTAYGPRTAGLTGATPNLAGGFAPRIGQSVVFDVRGGLGGAIGALLVGTDRASRTLLNGTLLVGPSPITWSLITLQGRFAQVPWGYHTEVVPIPNRQSIVGLSLRWQAVFLDAQSSLAMTNGIELTIAQ